jgi:pimeloyl-ACP methyl ester carboxylesterase
VVELDALEKRCALTGTVGSNPTLSARLTFTPFNAIIYIVKSTYKEPFIPGSLKPYFDADDGMARTAHEYMADRSPEYLFDEMPPVKVAEVNGKRLLYAELPAIDSHSQQDEALVLSLPHANGWKPHMYLRARYLQEAAAPEQRLIVLPNSSNRAKAYELTTEELAKVEQGDITPIAERQARLIKHLGIGRTSLMGYSFGAMEAAVLSRVLAEDAELIALGIFEPTNIMDRSPKELEKAFTKPGLKPLIKAVKDAQMPALSQVMSQPGLTLDILKFGLAAHPLSPFAIKENKAIYSGMAVNNLSTDLNAMLNQQPNTPVFMASGAESLIAPLGPMHSQYVNIYKPERNLGIHAVEDYGHEMGDNVVAHGLLGKAALEQARK